MRYVCIVCGYIYDPAHGDPVAGIPPGTAFEDLPDSWVCPECAASKEMFEPVRRASKLGQALHNNRFWGSRS